MKTFASNLKYISKTLAKLAAPTYTEHQHSLYTSAECEYECIATDYNIQKLE